jgi:CheY-like chemotaxis protein
MLTELFSSSTEALSYLQSSKNAFDLLLLDVQMPEMDGFMLAKSLREHPPLAGLPPMIFLSSSGMKGDGQQARELGVAAYYSKPVLEDELIAGIQRVLAPNVHFTAVPPEPALPLVTRHSVRESQRHLKVLLVEDHPVNQKLAVGLLSRWGHDCFVAADGRAGVDAFESQDFDVILMDVQMPVMSGLEATRAIRQLEQAQQKPRMPIIAMTANAMQGDREVCLEAGMDDYIAKPIKAKELQAMLDALAYPDAVLEDTEQ